MERVDSPSPERRALWGASAWAYLDTDPTEDIVRRAAGVLAASGKPLAELRRIDRQEVAPALWREAWFGDWLVTDAPDDPVVARIAVRLHRPLWWLRLTENLTRPFTWRMSRDYWRRLGRFVQQEREEP